MTAATAKLPLVLDAPRAELARLCRKLLLDFERGSGATSVSESEFLNLLATVQSRHGADALGEDDLWEILKDEERRMLDAFVVADLLLPKIAALLRDRAPVQSGPEPAPQAAAVPPPVQTPAAPQYSARPPAPTPIPQPQPAPRSAPLGIADLLDGMLDQERNENRDRSTTRGRS